MKNALAEKLNVDFINMTNVLFNNYLINFGHGTKAEKQNILKSNPQKHVIMDLTCFDPQEFYDEYPQLKGSFAALFCDENKKMEFHSLQNEPEVIAKFKELGFFPTETSIISCGFIFPRTIVQIINEAFFALEEEVASKEDINRAMKFGVNYPKGPFEWCEGRELVVLTLLNELFEKTGDKRYVASKLIRS
jgi:3-hydroxybutyryl-CoA dehydrogenase